MLLYEAFSLKILKSRMLFIEKQGKNIIVCMSFLALVVNPTCYIEFMYSYSATKSVIQHKSSSNDCVCIVYMLFQETGGQVDGWQSRL